MSKGDKKMFNVDLEFSEEELRHATEIKAAVEKALKQVYPKIDFTMILCYWVLCTPAEA
jgi:hypothetical protein